MLRLILAALQFVALILGRVFQKRGKLKTAEEQLPDKSPTAEVLEDADRRAEEKFKKESQ